MNMILYLNNRPAISKWNKLSMKEKSAYIRTAVRNGIENLEDIKLAYNEFAEGGDTNNSYIYDWNKLDLLSTPWYETIILKIIPDNSYIQEDNNYINNTGYDTPSWAPKFLHSIGDGIYESYAYPSKIEKLQYKEWLKTPEGQLHKNDIVPDEEYNLPLAPNLKRPNRYITKEAALSNMSNKFQKEFEASLRWGIDLDNLELIYNITLENGKQVRDSGERDEEGNEIYVDIDGNAYSNTGITNQDIYTNDEENNQESYGGNLFGPGGGLNASTENENNTTKVTPIIGLDQATSTSSRDNLLTLFELNPLVPEDVVIKEYYDKSTTPKVSSEELQRRYDYAKNFALNLYDTFNERTGIYENIAKQHNVNPNFKFSLTNPIRPNIHPVEEVRYPYVKNNDIVYGGTEGVYAKTTYLPHWEALNDNIRTHERGHNHRLGEIDFSGTNPSLAVKKANSIGQNVMVNTGNKYGFEVDENSYPYSKINKIENNNYIPSKLIPYENELISSEEFYERRKKEAEDILNIATFGLDSVSALDLDRMNNIMNLLDFNRLGITNPELANIIKDGYISNAYDGNDYLPSLDENVLKYAEEDPDLMNKLALIEYIAQPHEFLTYAMSGGALSGLDISNKNGNWENYSYTTDNGEVVTLKDMINASNNQTEKWKIPASVKEMIDKARQDGSSSIYNYLKYDKDTLPDILKLMAGKLFSLYEVGRMDDNDNFWG